jgi:hypothetical protein
LPQWFDAVVEEVLNEGKKLRVTYKDEIPEDEDAPPPEEDDLFGGMESSASERATTVDIEKCRPFRCIGMTVSLFFIVLEISIFFL